MTICAFVQAAHPFDAGVQGETLPAQALTATQKAGGFPGNLQGAPANSGEAAPPALLRRGSSKIEATAPWSRRGSFAGRVRPVRCVSFRIGCKLAIPDADAALATRRKSCRSHGIPPVIRRAEPINPSFSACQSAKPQCGAFKVV